MAEKSEVASALEGKVFSADIRAQSVDKQLDIHNARCAKPVLLAARRNLSRNCHVGIPPLCSAFSRCQVLDPVGKIGLIHKKIDVYYYYQSIYIQLNLKQ
jgi:hypothetical protein